MCRKPALKLWSVIWKRPRPRMSRCRWRVLTRWYSRLAPARVRRCVQISSMGTGQPPRPGTDDVWAAYITAKTAAEDDLRARDLDWTILRPGGLTDAPATGMIRLAPPPVPRGTVPRADVAAVIAALLDNPGTRHQTLELTGGDSPIATAVHSIS